MTIRFYNTTGIELDRINSNLFSSMTIREEDSNTTLEFYKRDSVETVGYDISYDGNGNTTVFFNPKASVGSESAPLKNMTIVVDPGHVAWMVALRASCTALVRWRRTSPWPTRWSCRIAWRVWVRR